MSQLEYPIKIHLRLDAPIFAYLSKDGNLIEVTVRDEQHKKRIIAILQESFDLPD